MKSNEKTKSVKTRKYSGVTALLVLIFFLSFVNVYADEIGSSTCGNPIIVQGNFQHYTPKYEIAVANATDANMYL